MSDEQQPENAGQESHDPGPDSASTPTPDPHPAELAAEQAEHAAEEVAQAAGESQTPTSEDLAAVQAAAAAADGTKSETVMAGAGVKSGAATSGEGDAQAFAYESFDSGAPESGSGPLSLLDDVNLDVKIELGRTRMYVEDVLKLNAGAVVELDKLAGDPVDIYVNERHVARGEVLVLNDNFCVRISEILNPDSDEAS